ncbi:MAG: hypothetical protein BWY51_00967 [Parcubacteria group bacterium ADurb.Bin316]|nr:MAG: hypothetical protein BWY51_00967 [Parcubacteria group bacterium ADurb.Bin316]
MWLFFEKTKPNFCIMTRTRTVLKLKKEVFHMKLKDFFKMIENTQFGYFNGFETISIPGGRLGMTSFGDIRNWISLRLPNMTVIVSSGLANKDYGDYEIVEIIKLHLRLYTNESIAGYKYIGSSSEIELQILPPSN